MREGPLRTRPGISVALIVPGVHDFSTNQGEKPHMKKFLLPLALVLVAGVAVAQAADTKSAEKAPAKAASAKAATKTHVVEGEVVSADATAKTITLKEKDKDTTFTLAEKAKVMIHGKAGSLDELKAGDHVTVRYTEKDGAEIAQEVSTAKTPAKKG